MTSKRSHLTIGHPDREWFYNPACDWYDGPAVTETRDGQKYFLYIPRKEYYNGITNIPKVERKRK